MYYEIRADVISTGYYSVYYYWCINVHELCSNPMSFLWKFMYGGYLGIVGSPSYLSYDSFRKCMKHR